jgi:hypothetical protein
VPCGGDFAGHRDLAVEDAAAKAGQPFLVIAFWRGVAEIYEFL